MVLGLGVGHFKGWSERLELQEQYADIREERMDELTESLVSCMTGNYFEILFPKMIICIKILIIFLGEEGRGGDDQDLDDIVIRQLKDENEKLKDELQLLREVTARYDIFFK